MKSGSAKRKYASFLIFLFISILILALGCDQQSSAKTQKFHKTEIEIENLKTKAIQIISSGLNDPDPRIRANTIEVIADTRQIHLMPQVLELANDDFMPVKFAAALAIGDTKYAPGKEIAKELLNDQDQIIKVAASFALSKLGQELDWQLLTKSISSQNQTLRGCSALILGKTGDKKALKLLRCAMNNYQSSEPVKLQAAEAIAQLGDQDIYPKLWTMLISAYKNDRAMGIKAMAELGTLEARNALITMLKDDSVEIRLIAAEKLGSLGDISGEIIVVEVFEKKLSANVDKSQKELIDLQAALAIGKIATKPVIKYLPTLLQNDSKLVRIAAAKAVYDIENAN